MPSPAQCSGGPSTSRRRGSDPLVDQLAKGSSSQPAASKNRQSQQRVSSAPGPAPTACPNCPRRSPAYLHVGSGPPHSLSADSPRLAQLLGGTGKTAASPEGRTQAT